MVSSFVLHFNSNILFLATHVEVYFDAQQQLLQKYCPLSPTKKYKNLTKGYFSNISVNVNY